MIWAFRVNHLSSEPALITFIVNNAHTRIPISPLKDIVAPLQARQNLPLKIVTSQEFEAKIPAKLQILRMEYSYFVENTQKNLVA